MSGKSVAQKLLIKENYKVLLVNEPENYRSILGKLPDNVHILTEGSESFDLAQVFITSKTELVTYLEALKSKVKPGGLFWITYPKGTSKQKVDINRDIIWEIVKIYGFTAVAMISIDDTWSAMRLKAV